MGRDIVSWAARSAWVVAGAGVLGLVTIALFFGGFGAAFGTLNDISLLVMTLAIVPVMAGFYELGGRTPMTPARASLAIGIGAVLAWCAIQALLIAGAVSFMYDKPASGPFAIEAVAVAVIGLWMAGANLLAGPWLRGNVRWLGVVTGLGIVVFGAGLLIGGAYDAITFVGGVPYQVLLPIWAYLVARQLKVR